ncbi:MULTISPECIES: Lsr2 dimerization domain-containing protein [Amycolatopsis]|uniref:Lsr2 dimerization domain-containing protein n=1 Tax=Amycolatopsis albispora TaxID=1804986 RepID=A0A344KZU1_9PSEU|nr:MULTISPECIES: histone-like nucleoid-structuring protein Lsr2 [Amycolatopsis]AXB41315.1 hypothetical protein A4R43_01260 [Amycolatopsis albispora]
MAKKVLLVDDFDHETPASETVLFAIDGDAFAADLSDEHAEELREAIAPFRDVATKIGKFKPERRVPTARKNGSAPSAKSVPAPADAVPMSNGKPWYKSDRSGTREVERAKKQYRDLAKQWGRENGFDIGSRGIVAEEVYTEYEAYRREKGLPVGPAAVGLA